MDTPINQHVYHPEIACYMHTLPCPCLQVRNATAYGMINLSDMKPVPMSGEAVYR